jgi:hypothetical protein
MDWSSRKVTFSYSRSKPSEFWLGHRPSLKATAGIVSALGHNRPLPNTLQFIIHLPSDLATLCSLATDSVVKFTYQRGLERMYEYFCKHSNAPSGSIRGDESLTTWVTISFKGFYSMKSAISRPHTRPFKKLVLPRCRHLKMGTYFRNSSRDKVMKILWPLWLNVPSTKLIILAHTWEVVSICLSSYFHLPKLKDIFDKIQYQRSTLCTSN